MRNTFSRINRFLAELCGWLMSMIAILLAVDVVSRGIRMPLQEVATLAVFVMVAVIYLGLANCEQENGHVTVNLLEEKLPPKLRKINEWVCQVVQLVIMGIAVYFVGQSAMNSFISKEALAGTAILPLWPAKFAMTIGLVFYWIQILLNLFGNPKEQKNPNSDTKLREK